MNPGILAFVLETWSGCIQAGWESDLWLSAVVLWNSAPHVSTMLGSNLDLSDLVLDILQYKPCPWQTHPRFTQIFQSYAYSYSRLLSSQPPPVSSSGLVRPPGRRLSLVYPPLWPGCQSRTPDPSQTDPVPKPTRPCFYSIVLYGWQWEGRHLKWVWLNESDNISSNISTTQWDNSNIYMLFWWSIKCLPEGFIECLVVEVVRC